MNPPSRRYTLKEEQAHKCTETNPDPPSSSTSRKKRKKRYQERHIMASRTNTKHFLCKHHKIRTNCKHQRTGGPRTHRARTRKFCTHAQPYCHPKPCRKSPETKGIPRPIAGGVSSKQNERKENNNALEQKNSSRHSCSTNMSFFPL